MAGIVFDRLTQNLSTASTASVYLYTTNFGKQMTAVVKSDQGTWSSALIGDYNYSQPFSIAERKQCLKGFWPKFLVLDS